MPISELGGSGRSAPTLDLLHHAILATSNGALKNCRLRFPYEAYRVTAKIIAPPGHERPKQNRSVEFFA